LTNDQAEQMISELRVLSIQIRKDRAALLSKEKRYQVEICEKLLLKHHEDRIIFMMQLSEKRRNIFLEFGIGRTLKNVMWLDRTVKDDQELIKKLRNIK
jgi:hypothetical protein